MRVFVDVTPWDMRSRNTDWRYVKEHLPRLIEWQPGIDLYLQRSFRVTCQTNFKTLRMAIGKRVGFPVGVKEWETDSLDVRELRESQSSLVFSHRGYPINAGDLPVVWQSSILDPVMTASYTEPKNLDVLREEDHIRAEYFGLASAVQVSTIAEAKRLARTFPSLANRFVPIPFFLPYLAAADYSCLERHIRADIIEILFVGNDVRRKGLDLLLEAFSGLSQGARRRTRLKIVSNFDRGGYSVASNEAITIHKGLGRGEVIDMMRRAHILVNLARFESYGFVFVEAMSQGMVCIGPDWEVQRELLDYGRAGSVLPCDAELLMQKLEALIEDDTYRFALAAAGHLRFKEMFSPTIVAEQYARMFQSVAKR